MGDSPYNPEEYDSKDEFLDGEFMTPDDVPGGGIDLPPEWTDELPDNPPHVEDAEQLGEKQVAYTYKGIPVTIRRRNTTVFEIRLDFEEYASLRGVRNMFYVERHGHIKDVADGIVVVELQNFDPSMAYECAHNLVDQHLEKAEHEENVSEALNHFN